MKKKILIWVVVSVLSVSLFSCDDDDLYKELDDTLWTCIPFGRLVYAIEFNGKHDVTLFTADNQLHLTEQCEYGNYSTEGNTIKFVKKRGYGGILMLDDRKYHSAELVNNTLVVKMSSSGGHVFTWTYHKYRGGTVTGNK